MTCLVHVPVYVQGKVLKVCRTCRLSLLECSSCAENTTVKDRAGWTKVQGVSIVACVSTFYYCSQCV